MDGERKQITGSEQRTDQQHGWSRDRPHSRSGGKSPARQIPFAHKAAAGRNSDQRQGQNRIAAQHHRHHPAETAHLFHSGPSGFKYDGAGRQEESVLDHGMEHHMG